MATTTFGVIPNSEHNGNVTFFDTDTGEYRWLPDEGVLEQGKFDYGVYCDTGSGPVLMSSATVYITVNCPDEMPTECSSSVPAPVLEDKCIKAGDSVITGTSIVAGVASLYNSKNQKIAEKPVSAGTNFSFDITPANVWDSYYITLREYNKTESRPSNIITVCPSPSSAPASGCSCGKCGHCCSSC